MDKSKRKTLIVTVLVLTFGRFAINITRRFLYPFVPTISEQLKVSASSVQVVISAQSAMGLLGPVFGAVSERYGRKRTIIGAQALMGGALLVLVVFPRSWMFALAMLGVGVAKIIYDPAAQAYIGDRVPYNRRGLVMGAMELNWASSLMFIAPIGGFLLGAYGLQSVFVLFAVFSIVVWVVTWRFLPALPKDENASIQTVNPLKVIRILGGNSAGMGAMGFSLCLVVANEIFFINYGLWMGESFDLVFESLGFVTITIAAAEVIGECLVLGMADRRGKRNMALLGAVCSGLTYLILPHLTFSLAAAMAGLFVLFVFVEVAIVASLPLFTEIMPDARAVMMSGNMGAHALGRLTGGALGGLLYKLTGDFALMGGISTIIGFWGVLLLWRWVREMTPAEP